jgi:hypothetical protein
MKKAIVSLDRVTEDPSWTFRSGSEGREMFRSAELAAGDALMPGRATKDSPRLGWA